MIMMMNCFCGMADPRKAEPYFQLRPLPEILTIANLWLATSRIRTCIEPVFRLWWMKLCSSDNHYTMAPVVGPLFNKVACFPVNFAKLLRMPTIKNTPRQMLLCFTFLVSILSLRTILFQEMLGNIFLCFLATTLIIKAKLEETYKKY